MPLLEIVQIRQVTASIRLDELTSVLIDQYAAFLHVSADDGRAVLIVSFNRAGGRDMQSCEQRFSKDYRHLSIYTANFMESVPGCFGPLRSQVSETECLFPCRIGQCSCTGMRAFGSRDCSSQMKATRA